jgi:Na+-translocating ferredoxin:NAD+ oxidoreductase RnfG subunit
MRYSLGRCSVAFLLIAIPATAQKTATQFYMDYQAAFAKAKTIDEILPFMSKDHQDEVKKTPAAERAKMFQMIKMMNDYTNVKVTKETKTPTGYTLEVTATDSDKKPAKGTVDIVNEGGAMKIKQESWKS